MKNAREKGFRGERLALAYLMKKGYRYVCRNYVVREGEIDLIVMNETLDTLVFVEVKTRKNAKFSHPAEAVTTTKQNRLSRSAMRFLMENPCELACRFDVIAICLEPHMVIEHIQHAFDLTE